MVSFSTLRIGRFARLFYRTFNFRQPLFGYLARTYWVRPLKLLSVGGGASFAVGIFGSKSGITDPEQSFIEQADVLYDAYMIENLLKLLKRKSTTENPEILWRLARATFELAKSQPPNSKEYIELTREAFGYIEHAMKCDGALNISAVHKWYAILLNKTSELDGTKAQLKCAYIVRQHFDKACDLNQKDATCRHLVGVWCFTFADMPGYQRKLASFIFATPPSSSYGEALNYFLAAERVQPMFYSVNHLYIAKCYIALNDVDKAIPYLISAFKFPVISVDDNNVHKESEQLLRKYKKFTFDQD